MARHAITLRDIARRTGVHESTVSRALNARTRHLVADDVAERIAAKARDMGYRPNIMAAALRTRRTLTVAVLLPDLADPRATQMLAGIEAALRGQGYATLVTVVTADELAQTVAGLEDRGVDGLIALGVAIDLAATELPLFAIEAAEPETGAAGPTGAEPGEHALPDVVTAVAHLAALGHRAIGHLGGPTGDAVARTRLSEFRGAMVGAGLFGTTVTSCDDWSMDAGRRGAEALLERRPELTALVAASNDLAHGALAAFDAHGLRCPTDVSLTGFGLTADGTSAVPLALARTDPRESGRQAALQLLAYIAGNAPTQHERSGATPAVPPAAQPSGTTTAVPRTA